MGRSCRIFLTAMALAVSPIATFASGKGWEPVRSDVSQFNSVASDNDLVVRVAPGQVIVSSSQQIHIKVFTILGQQVSNETLPPGVNRLSLSHGIYIVKVGDLTCKIAV